MTPAELPADPDVETGAARPPGLTAGALGLVFAGGTAGTLLRAALVRALGTGGHGPVVVAMINLTGALLLGLLLEALAAPGDGETGPRPDRARTRLRLACGTGFLGGFTTYSTFAVQLVESVGRGLPVAGVVLAAVTVAGGLAAAAVGALAGASCARVLRRTSRRMS